MDEIARLTPRFANVSYDMLDERGSLQGPCNDKAPEGSPIMYVKGFVRGKGKFIESIATEEKTGPRFPPLLTTDVGAQTGGTANSLWHKEDLLEIHPARRGKSWHPRRGLGAARLASPRARRRRARKSSIARRAWSKRRSITRHAGERHHHRLFRLGDQLPEYAVTAVRVSPSNGPSRRQEDYEKFSRHSRRIAVGRSCGVNA
jgi:formate dehydrogenase major subunit